MKYAQNHFIPDTMALIQLASVNRLNLLQQLGPVALVDMVEHEAVRRLDKPFAYNVSWWSNIHTMLGEEKAVSYISTETYAEYVYKKASAPGYKRRDAGEDAIIEWLGQRSGVDIVISNERKLAKLMKQVVPQSKAKVMNVQECLGYAAKQGLVVDPAGVWQQIQAVTANPPQRKFLATIT